MIFISIFQIKFFKNSFAGHLMDSWDLPGTAHFAEHMLFLGTAKYPEENEYSKVEIIVFFI